MAMACFCASTENDRTGLIQSNVSETISLTKRAEAASEEKLLLLEEPIRPMEPACIQATQRTL
jgi:hypothetical protein